MDDHDRPPSSSLSSIFKQAFGLLLCLLGTPLMLSGLLHIAEFFISQTEITTFHWLSLLLGSVWVFLGLKRII